jgi:hypothetical protein
MLVSKKTASDLHTYLKDGVRRLQTLFEETELDVTFGIGESG